MIVKNYLEIKELLKKKNVQKRIDYFSKKYKDKKIIIYGAGMLASILFENYDLSGLNIIAVADYKFTESDELFMGIKTISLQDIPKINPDFIILTVLEVNKSIKFINKNIFINNEKILIKSILKKNFLINFVENFTIDFIDLFKKLKKFKNKIEFSNSIHYWEKRYFNNGTSGPGSYGELAEFKAEVLNNFVEEKQINTVIELGCGDGNQLNLAKYPLYFGFDVAKSAITICQKKFENDPSKSFLFYNPKYSKNIYNFIKADLTISLDVIFHLVEDEIYYDYLQNLFNLSSKYVIIYCSDRTSDSTLEHVKERKFTINVSKLFPKYKLVQIIKNKYPEKTFADFYIYLRE